MTAPSDTSQPLGANDDPAASLYTSMVHIPCIPASLPCIIVSKAWP